MQFCVSPLGICNISDLLMKMIYFKHLLTASCVKRSRHLTSTKVNRFIASIQKKFRKHKPKKSLLITSTRNNSFLYLGDLCSQSFFNRSIVDIQCYAFSPMLFICLPDCFLFQIFSFIQVQLTYNEVNILKVYSLLNFDIYIYTSVKLSSQSV